MESLDWRPIHATTTLRAETPEGYWRVRAPQRSDPARINFNLADGRGHAEIRAAFEAENPTEGSDTYWRYCSLLGIGDFDHGYADTQQDALALIDVLLRGDASGDVDQILVAAGFRLCRTDKGVCTYHHATRTGFSLYISDREIYLEFQKSRWVHWVNLARFALRGDDFGISSGEEGCPLFWPDRVVQNFRILALRACLTMVDRYIADGRHMRRASRR